MPLYAPDKVERVLLNLLTNALRHTPSDGSVAVLVEPLSDEVRVSVEDTGGGLRRSPSAACSSASGAATTRSSRGAGPGLASRSRGLVEAHGGRIWAENREGGAARVSFTLPVA